MASSHYSRDLLDKIRVAVPLDSLVSEHVELRPSSGSLVCPCLFHSETKPSMHVYPDGHFYCYGCKAGGDVFDFVQLIEGVDFSEAVKRLAERANVPLGNQGLAKGKKAGRGLSRRDHVAITKKAAEFYHARLLSEEGKEARAYLLETRGITMAMVEAFGLGVSPDAWDALKAHLKMKGWAGWQALEARLITTKGKGLFDSFRNRVMFPIQAAGGAHLGFGGRTMNDDGAKYINSADSPHFKKTKLLYGLHQARKAIRISNQAIITEGYLDVVCMHQFGFTNSVAVLGTAFGQDHAAMLTRMCDKTVFLFDGDAPGRQAAFKAATLTLQAGGACRVALLPDGEDADSLLQKQGRAALAKLLDAAPGALGFCLGFLQGAAPRRIVHWVKDFLAGLADPRLRAVFVPKIAQDLDLSEYELRTWEEAQPPCKDVPQVDLEAMPMGQADELDDAPGPTAAPVQGEEDNKDLEADEGLLWGFVVSPNYCDVFRGRDIPFTTEGSKGFFLKLCAARKGEAIVMTSPEKRFYERCLDRHGQADGAEIYGWYGDLKKRL